MNTTVFLFSVLSLQFSVLASVKDTTKNIPGSEQSFTDKIFNNDTAISAETASRAKKVFNAYMIRPTDTVSMDTIVVTAARREQSSEWVSDDHSVVEVDKIKQSTSKSVSELLSGSISAQITDYGSGATKKISLRGAGSERTLVLIDGKRVGTNDGDLGDIAPGTIKKIEVVEGGQSALYGMDAVGGVINIITKRPISEKLTGSFSSVISSFKPNSGRPGINANGYDASVGKMIGPVKLLTAGNWQYSDGRYEYVDQSNQYKVRSHNSFRNWNVSQYIGYTRSDFLIGVNGSYRDRFIDNPGSIKWPSLATTRKNISYLDIDGAWTANKIMTLKMNGALGYDNVHYIDPDPYMPQESRHSRFNQDLEFLQEFTFCKQKVTTGIQGRRQIIQSNEIGDHDIRQGAAFAAAIGEVAITDFTIEATPVIRFDYSNLFKSTYNGKIGFIAAWNGIGQPAIFTNIGSSFRNPDANDLYWPRDMYTVGNPNLKPEKSMNIDGGIQLHHKSGVLDAKGRVTGYLMTLNEMITWQPDSTGIIWSPRNIANALVKGAHGHIQILFGTNFTATFDFTYNNARDVQSKKVLIYRPEYVAVYSNTFTADRLSAGLVCRYSSLVYTNDGNTKSLPSNTTFDANIGYKVFSMGAIDKGIRLVYDVLNITNEQHITNEGYPLPGREHRLSLKMNF